jgi:hypothetical protein
MRKDKDWLAQNQEKGSEWINRSTRRKNSSWFLYDIWSGTYLVKSGKILVGDREKKEIYIKS